jgi:hypothetical protein
LDVAGPPMIHVTRSRLPELILFGKSQTLETPLAVNAGNQIMVTSTPEGEISISKFAAKEADQKRIVSTKVDDVIRAIVDLGGTYPDVVQALQEAKATGALATRIEVDALPETGRTYDRVADANDEDKDGGASKKEVADAKKPSSPAPDLFYRKSAADAGSTKNSEETDANDDSEEKTAAKKGFWSRMFKSRS